MEKVKLTQEQEDEIIVLMREPYNNTKDELLVEHSKHGGFVSLNKVGISLPLLAKALYGVYEVKPNIKIGDTVFVSWLNREGEFYKVEDVLSNGRIVIDNKNNDKPSMDIVRLATPEEIFWNDNDRGVWEIREGDTLEYLGDLLIVDSLDSEDVCFKRNKNYPEKYMENFDYVKEHFKVFCFAEDRKDV